MSNQYWFKRRRYGWGWTPVTWQGWLCLVVFLSAILLAALRMPAKPDITDIILLLLVTLSGVLLLIGIAYAKGPQPRWRMGKKPTDNPDEDF